MEEKIILEKVEIGNCTLYLGDCFKIIKLLEDKSIDLIHTDPPYLIHSDTNVGKMMENKGVKSQQEKLIKADISNSFDYGIFEEFNRICKNPNYQIWCSKKQFVDYLNYANNNDYSWQDIMLYRNNALPNVNGKFQDKDYLVYMWKGRKITGKYNEKVTDYHWNIGGKKRYNHPCLKPVEPIINLIKVGSDENDTILDCFMGSGTTGEACIKTNRKFIGMENNKEFFDIAVSRLKEIQENNFDKVELIDF